ncbi:unnamed protein product [Sympodiomycopsis kandeliae]
MTNADDHHHYTRSARQRLSRIAGQLGAGLTSTPVRPPPPKHSSDDDSRGRHSSISSALTSALSRPTSSITKSEEKEKKWSRLPRYKDLPIERGHRGCAWSIWGTGDKLGCLNLLTDEVRYRAAKEEIRTGTSISLSWPMHLPLQPGFSRRKFEHKAWGKKNATGEMGAKSDDEIHLNPQSGSQWDGFAHFGHLQLNSFYGGHSREQIHNSFNRDKDSSSTEPYSHGLSIHHWAEKGIIGRGVLLDVWGFLTRNNDNVAPYDPSNNSYSITLEDIRNCAQAQGIVFHRGDILLIRTGWIEWYEHASDQERKEASSRGQYPGLTQDEDLQEYLWNHHISAIASDSPTLENWPVSNGTTHLHEVLLGLFGMPIGEMFNLEQLQQHCLQNRRWSFYFSSWPLMNVGGVSSLANAGATF